MVAPRVALNNAPAAAGALGEARAAGHALLHARRPDVAQVDGLACAAVVYAADAQECLFRSRDRVLGVVGGRAGEERGRGGGRRGSRRGAGCRRAEEIG